MKNDNIDFLENIKRRERKTQMLVYSFVSICLVFGLAILYFVNIAKTAEKKATENAEKAENAEEKAKKAEEKAIAINKLLTENQKENDKLVKFKDSLLNVYSGNKIMKDAEKVFIKNTVEDKIMVKEVTILKRNSVLLSLPNDKLIDKSDILMDKYSIKQKSIIYIQAYGNDGEVIGNTLKNRLRNKNYIVPNVEIIKRKDNNRVTYFFDEDQKYAESVSKELIQVLRDAKIEFDEKKYIPQKSKIEAKQRQIEVWVNF